MLAQSLNLQRDLPREQGISDLFITHNIAVVEYIADQVAVMRAGRIVEQGACADVLQRPVNDYTRTLLAAVPRLWPRGAGAAVPDSSAEPSPAATPACRNRPVINAAGHAWAAIPASVGSPVAAKANRLCCSYPTAGSLRSRGQPLAAAQAKAAQRLQKTCKCLSILRFPGRDSARLHQTAAPARRAHGSRGFP